MSSLAVPNRRHLYPFNTDLIARPSRRILVWYCLGSCLMKNLLLMSLHVSSEIHKLWRAIRLSGFGTARCNSANILSAYVLV